MSQKLRLIGTAAVLAVIPLGAGLAMAQSDGTAVQKGAVAPTVLQTAPIVKAGPVSRPVKWGALPGVQGVISAELTEKECTGLGGTVNDVPTAKCESGKGCVTADKDGTIHAVCIDKK